MGRLNSLRPRNLLHKPVVRNAVALYGAQFATYALPLLSVPYLARVLGPENWGEVAFAQVVGIYISLVVDFGFNLSATRAVAREREDPQRLSAILSGVTGAKALLSVVCLTAILLLNAVSPWSPARDSFVWLGALWGIAGGLRPLWFFLGIERVQLVTTIDILLRGVATLALFVVVRSPEDAILVLILLFIGSAASATFAMALAFRTAALTLPSPLVVIQVMRSSLNLFLYRVSINMYVTSNVIILGIVASPVALGFYAGADKISKAIMGLMDPAAQAIYPFSSNLAASSMYDAARAARKGVLVLALLSCCACAVILVFAPAIIRIGLGPGYEPAVPVLRILSLTFPALGVSVPLAVQWIFPIGLESLLTKISFVAGALHIPLAVVLGARYSGVGTAWALFATETFVVAAIIVSLWKRNLNPMTFGQSQVAVEHLPIRTASDVK